MWRLPRLQRQEIGWASNSNRSVAFHVLFLDVFELKHKSVSKPRATNSYWFDNLAVVLSAELKCPSHKSQMRLSFIHKDVWVTSEVQFKDCTARKLSCLFVYWEWHFNHKKNGLEGQWYFPIFRSKITRTRVIDLYVKADVSFHYHSVTLEKGLVWNP